MAQFQNVVITKKGQALMAKMMAGVGNVRFTKINTSSQIYTAGQLEALTALTNVKQTTLVSNITRTNSTAIKIEGAINNATLMTGYACQTVGVYALDPDDGEILYGVTIVIGQADFIPPFNGVTSTGIKFELIITVGNATNVTLQIDPAAVATVGDLDEIYSQISDLQSYVGYTEADIYGVEADFKNKRFKRIAGAANKTPGAMFDGVECFGGRRRCNVTDGGVIVAYHGDSAYTETGKLTQVVTIGEITHPVGTVVQAMVYQPKFYYKVVPLELERVVNGKGFHMRKARYYVSVTHKSGFKLHPAFLKNGVEKPYILIGAYEGCLFDTSAASYILNDAQVADFAADKLSSVSNAKPASGLNQELNRRNCGKLAENRGAGWSQEYGAISAATQLLMVVEYGGFNTQNLIGRGNVDNTDDGATNMAIVSGGTSTLGNVSGNAIGGINGKCSVSYRGEENPWGNIWKFVDGLNVEPFSKHELYVADNAFTESKTDGSYKNAGITLAKTNGFISAMAYNEPFDWLFFPSETLGDSNLPVGDHFWQNNEYTGGFLIALLGAGWGSGSYAGGFCWHVHDAVGARYRHFGGRLVYVPA